VGGEQTELKGRLEAMNGWKVAACDFTALIERRKGAEERLRSRAQKRCTEGENVTPFGGFMYASIQVTIQVVKRGGGARTS